MGKLNEIVEIYASLGKNEVSVAVIQNGTTEEEKVGYGKIKNILQVVEENQLSSPAIIVIGDVVKKRVALSSVIQDFKIKSIAV